MARTLVAPSEGEADTHRAIADELNDVLTHIDRVDYDALVHENLRELLAARETVEELCLKHRDMQREYAADTDNEEGDGT